MCSSDLSTLMGLVVGSADIAKFSAERAVAATSLATFKGVGSQLDATITALQGIVTEGLQKGDVNAVTEARTLLKTLGG
mgnify:CR=1 FL=1